MTPWTARAALFGFLMVTAGVAVNALYLQARAISRDGATANRQPIRPVAPAGVKAGAAPTAHTNNSSQEQALRIARFGADPTRIERAPAVPDEAASIDTIRAVQRELRLRGYGPIAGDGVMTLATRAAVMAFEHDSGMALSGEASGRLLKRILLGAADPAGIDNSSAGKVQSPHAEQVIRDVQQRLAALGYQPGSINGRPGEDTVSAIRDFEMDKGLVPRGRVSADLVTRLSEAAAPRQSGR